MYNRDIVDWTAPKKSGSDESGISGEILPFEP